MRREIVVLGSFIIVLILIAGCTSAQNGAANGSKKQNPTSGYSAIKTTSPNSLTAIINCDRPPIDPVEFYKYLPNVQGYERKAARGEKMNYAKFNKTSDNSYENIVADTYKITDTSKLYWVTVAFEDLGPCAESGGRLNWNWVGFTTNKLDFHGYPTVRLIWSINSSSEEIKQVNYYIGMNDRLFVRITFSSDYGSSLSEAEAEIEKFASAIDFKGFAASA